METTTQNDNSDPTPQQTNIETDEIDNISSFLANPHNYSPPYNELCLKLHACAAYGFDDCIENTLKDMEELNENRFHNEINTNSTSNLLHRDKTNHIDCKDPNYLTPLMWAAESHSLVGVSKLCKMGANINAKDALGQTALHLALGQLNNEKLNDKEKIAQFNQGKDVINTLLKYGSDVNAQMENSDNITPLFFSTVPSVTKQLLEKGSKVDAIGPYGFTPLLLAASRCDIDTAQILIQDGGANPNFRSSEIDISAAEIAKQQMKSDQATSDRVFYNRCKQFLEYLNQFN
eukprot:gb/GECH01012363.1/.p1 GENE.gb/GECH01012363.1/~~gb/GECH01012363.1/.p1  ORF type:complete len:290 (+),score=82.96 gb/GECH01012363.1/:1-870(+)